MYYPEQRLATRLIRFKRRAMLPEEALGNVLAKQGQQVDIRDNVARGLIPSEHIIIDAMTELNLNSPDELRTKLLVSFGTRVEEGRLIAGQEGGRSRKILAPTEGVIVAIDRGRIIFQRMPRIISLDAGVRGRVTKVEEGRGVEIEGQGAIIQGVWGNGANIIAILRNAPEHGGLDSINPESLEAIYRGEVVVARRPLTQTSFEIADARQFAGIIAPSMPIELIETAMNSELAVMLTEGFGEINMPQSTYNLLTEYADGQVTLDASQPRRFDPRRPEAVINRRAAQDETVPVGAYRALAVGDTVRVTRPPYRGRLGTVVTLPHQPRQLNNGLRVRCAEIQISAGQTVHIPLANLELSGTE